MGCEDHVVIACRDDVLGLEGEGIALELLQRRGDDDVAIVLGGQPEGSIDMHLSAECVTDGVGQTGLIGSIGHMPDPDGSNAGSLTIAGA